ncbi:MAG: single-stranded-DNA-specific exonuclease RecJ [Aggregatilineales bacterium]
MRRWQFAPPVEPDSALLTLVGGQPIAAAALIRRGYADPERARAFLDPANYTPTPPSALPDLDHAADLLLAAIRAQQSLLIWGDFDADGQTATALLVDALRPFVDPARLWPHIPDRLTDGHGIQVERLKTIIESERPAVLLTCDTGITAHEAVTYANERGVIVIITDHHDLPATLPNAAAIVNPQRLPPGHPLAALPGVGVAYKLIERLYKLLGVAPDAARLLDLVALGIVADVAALVDDTRYLLQIGLTHLRRAERPGIRALFESARIDPRAVTADAIGFQLGPRLNAAGRFGDPLLSVELLTTPDPARAAMLAHELEGLNRERRRLQRAIEDAARQMITIDPSLVETGALVLYHPDWHPGVLGPVAGRLAERYERPAILLTALDRNETVARGSGRSAAGLDLSAALSTLPGLLISYGGHPGAAGLTLPVANITGLKRALGEAFAVQTRALSANADAESDALTIDAELSLADLTPALANALAQLAPFGEGNPPVLLCAADVQITSAAFLDRAHVHRRLTVQDATGKRHPVYWWNSGDDPMPTDQIDLAYTVGVAPDGEIQIELVAHQPHAALKTEPIPIRQVIDLRHEPSPRAILDRLRAENPALSVWAEGYSQRESPGLARHELASSVPLAIWTAPPSSVILAETLRQLDPPAVYVFGVDPPPPLDGESPVEFIRQVEGIVQFVVNRQDGQVSLAALCGRLAQPAAVIRHALRGLPALMYIEHGDRIELHSRDDSDPSIVDDPIDKQAWFIRLEAMLAETRAYRAYFRRAPLDGLLND